MIPKDINQKISRRLWNLMSFGAPISYTWPHQETVIGELVRIAGKKLCSAFPPGWDICPTLPIRSRRISSYWIATALIPGCNSSLRADQ